VPLASLDPATGNAQIAVVNLAVNPNQKNPIKKIIVLGHPDIPTGTALDNTHSQIIAVSGNSGSGGFVDIINENTNQLVNGSPFAFPTGSESGYFGQVLYDPVRDKAIVATLEITGCPTAGTCTGFATFDPIAHTFGPIISANYPETFAFNSQTNVIIDASDSDSTGQIGAVDVTNSVGCTLSDSNINGDADGSSIDSNTNIVVVSNEDGTASVINLNGSTFSGTTPPCQLNEAGTLPNSVLISGLPGGTAGSAVDPATHQAFLIEDGSNGITLLQLPSASVTQIAPTDIGAPVITTLPNDPNGSSWSTAGDPYAVAVSSCKDHPFGYAVDSSFNFLVRVDLKRMNSNPTGISTALPAGSCAGTSTTSKCDNGNGVRFYPLS
jgi:hypothetical protein